MNCTSHEYISRAKLYKIQIKILVYSWANYRNRWVEGINLEKSLFFQRWTMYNAAKAQGCAESSREGAEHLVHFSETVALIY